MLFFYEVKKIMKQKIFLIGIFCMLLITIGLGMYEIYSQPYYTQNGQYETGISSIRKLREQKKVFREDMSDVLVQKVYKAYQTILQEPVNFNAYGELNMEQVGYDWQQISGLSELLVRTYSSMQCFDKAVLSNKKVEEVQALDILSSREKQLKNFLNMSRENQKPLFTKAEKKKVLATSLAPISNEQKKEYEDALGWKVLFSHLQILLIATLVISAIIGSRIFSSEVQTRTSTLLYSSKRGRGADVLYKMLAAVMVMSACVLCFQALYASLILGIFGTSGAQTLILYQSVYWLSIFPFTNLEAYLYIVALGYGGNFVILVVSMLCSRFTKKEYQSLMLSFLVLFVPMVWKAAYPIFPVDMCNGNFQLMTFSIRSILHFALYDYELQFSITVLSAFSLLFLYHSYHRKRKVVLLE